MIAHDGSDIFLAAQRGGQASLSHDTEMVCLVTGNIKGETDFVAVDLRGGTLMQGEAKVANQVHTKRRTQYFTALTSPVKAKRRTVAKTAAQILMYMVTFSILSAHSIGSLHWAWAQLAFARAMDGQRLPCRPAQDRRSFHRMHETQERVDDKDSECLLPKRFGPCKKSNQKTDAHTRVDQGLY